MSRAVTVTNPPPADQMPPLPGPGDVRLDHLPVTRRTRPTYPVGNIHHQKRPRKR